MPPEIRPSFDPIRLELVAQPQGIQASAGTGKTYSIAFLAVRMVLEVRDIGIGNLLMVTFTNAAVAELQVRVRSFIRKALKVARDPSAEIHDDLLKALVRFHMRHSGRASVLEKLNRASLLLEDLQVCTIHSFCLKVLRDFSFETGEVFDAEMMAAADWDQMLDEQVNRFWRKDVASLPPDVIYELMEFAGEKEDGTNRARAKVLQLVKDCFSGKRAFVWGRAAEVKLANLGVEIGNVCEEKKKSKEEWLRAVRENWEAIRDAAQANKSAWKNFSKFFEEDNYTGLAEQLIKLYGSKVFARQTAAPVDLEMQNLQSASNKLEELMRQLIALLAQMAYEQAKRHVAAIRMENPTRTFDDLVCQVRDALQNQQTREVMRVHLRAQYKAVFIDEFQDTDGDQYAIFKALFGDDHFLYYIGDPKQSIYGFRKADIETYLRAMDEVAILHQMNTNRRSCTSMITAMNEFFGSAPNLDPFNYGNRLPYVPVNSPSKNDKAVLCYDRKPIPPIRYSLFEKKFKQERGLVSLVDELVRSGRYTFLSDGVHQQVRATDIGILVNKNKTGRTIKAKLSAAGIPAITVDDAKVLQSDESKQLYRVLVGIHERSRSTVNLAMLTDLAGLGVSGLLEISEEKVMERFRNYNETWVKSGVYVMLQQFLADHQVYSRYFDDPASKPDRIISNILQLADLLHRVSTDEKLNPADQIRWLKKRIDGSESEGDEYIQRLERDEEAVKIITIHKAKGLEYPIVICPELNFTTNPFPGGTSGWREEDEYFTMDSSSIGDLPDKLDLFTEQRERENRRLLYVSITRARQACFILFSKRGAGTIGEFYRVHNPVENDGPDVLIQKWLPPPSIRTVRTTPTAPASRPVYSDPTGFRLTGTEWRKSSFSALSPSHSSPPQPRAVLDGLDPYSVFTFHELRRGSRTGDMLHDILEAVDFTKPETWAMVVERTVSRYQPRFSVDFLKKVEEMLGHITSAVLLPDSDFTLAALPRTRRRVELEFDFQVERFALSQMTQLLGDHTPIRLHNGEMEGLMNGFIDLLFEADGKYYILDWKSNYLGDNTGHYSFENMHQAMEENNYHLQYHLYLVAATRYLRQRVKDFDYERHFGGVLYLFLRGVRSDSDTGVYFTRPSLETLEGMERLFLTEQPA